MYVFCCGKLHSCNGDNAVAFCGFEEAGAVPTGVVVCQRYNIQPVQCCHTCNGVWRAVIISAGAETGMNMKVIKILVHINQKFLLSVRAAL